MSGAVQAIKHILVNNAGLIAVVPSTRISAGPLPQSTSLPIVSLDLVSRTELQMVDGGSGLYRSRVQITVAAADYPTKVQVLELVRAALPRSRGTHNGIAVDSVIPDGLGPDMADEESGIFLGSVDYLVTHTTA